jgi:hypothetical protein
MRWQRAATAEIDGAFVPAPAADVGFVDADGEGILVAEATNELHLLNRTAALLWQCFDGESPIADICFDLAEVLDIPFEQALTDTIEVVSGLDRQGLVHDARGLQPDADRDASKPALEVPRPPRLVEEPPGG